MYMKATGAFTDSLWLTFNTTFFRAAYIRLMSRPFYSRQPALYVFTEKRILEMVSQPQIVLEGPAKCKRDYIA
jgi:hypothetical protein